MAAGEGFELRSANFSNINREKNEKFSSETIKIGTSQSSCFIEDDPLKGQNKGQVQARERTDIMEITYSKHGGYCLPDLVLPNEEPATYGRFGQMRLNYLKEHRRATYITLKTTGQLTCHLNEIDREANEMLRFLTQQMAQAQGITEKMKEDDPMAWVGAMNNIRGAAEEQIYHEVIFA